MIAQQGYVVVYGSADWGDGLITLGVSNLLPVIHSGKRLLGSVTLERGSLVGVIHPGGRRDTWGLFIEGGGRVLGIIHSRRRQNSLGYSPQDEAE